MPRRATHSVTGCAVGVLTAATLSSPGPGPGQLLELVGGGTGGLVGGLMPDLLEPAHTPRHRGTAHSVAAAGFVFKVAREELAACRDFFRRWADEFARRRTTARPGSADVLMLTQYLSRADSAVDGIVTSW